MVSGDIAPQFGSTNFRYWADAVCDTFVDVDCLRTGDFAFEGKLDRRSLLDTRIVRVKATTHAVERQRDRIARSAGDFVLLSVMRKGSGTIFQCGREARLNAGDFAIYDTTLPFRFVLDEPFSQICLRIEREEFCRRVGEVQPLAARAINGQSGLGRLASMFICELSDQLERTGEGSAQRLHTTMLDLVASALGEQLDRTAALVGEGRHLQLQRVFRIVEERLFDPELTCALIAGQLGMSERYLRKLFEGREMSLSDWIWHRRLEEARQRLADPRSVRSSVTAIAYDCGFKDSAHFSRAFRTKFRLSPREFRDGAGAISRSHLAPADKQ